MGLQGVGATIAETTQTFTKMLTLGLNTMLLITFRPKVSIIVTIIIGLFQLLYPSPPYL